MDDSRITEQDRTTLLRALKRGYFTETDRANLKDALGVETLEIHLCSKREHTRPDYVIPTYKGPKKPSRARARPQLLE